MNSRNIYNYIEDNKLNTCDIIENYFNNKKYTKYNKTLEIIKDNLKNRKDNINNVIDTIFEIHTSLKSNNRLLKRNITTDSNLYNIKQLLLCVICQDICSNCIYISCCENVYCSKCILLWINDNNNCRS